MKAASARPEYLLVEEETPEGLRLNNPAGHLDAGESPLAGGGARSARGNGARLRARAAGRHLSRACSAGEPAKTSPVCASPSPAAWASPTPARPLDAGIVAHALDDARRAARLAPAPSQRLLLRCIEDAAAGCAVPLERIVTEASVYAPEISAERAMNAAARPDAAGRAPACAS